MYGECICCWPTVNVPCILNWPIHFPNSVDMYTRLAIYLPGSVPLFSQHLKKISRRVTSRSSSRFLQSFFSCFHSFDSFRRLTDGKRPDFVYDKDIDQKSIQLSQQDAACLFKSFSKMQRLDQTSFAHTRK